MRGEERPPARHVLLEAPGEGGSHRDRVGEDEDAVPREVARGVDDVELVAALLEEPGHPEGGRVVPPDRELLGREDADLGHGPGGPAPGLLLLHPGVDPPDQLVGGGVEAARRVELVAHRAPGPLGQHLEALELEGRPVLVGVEVAPRGVELAGHPQAVHPEGAGVAHGQREVQVAPPPARQGLQLQVGVGGEDRPQAGVDVAPVVEDRAVRGERADERGEVPDEAPHHLAAEGEPGRRLGGVEALLDHRPPAARARAVLGLHDVEEEPVHRHRLEQVPQVLLEEGDVGRVQAQEPVEAGLVGGRPLERALGGDLSPLGVLVGRELVPLDGHVDGHPDAPGVAGRDLLLEEPVLQVGVAALREAPGVVVDEPVVAAGEAGDRVHPGPGEGGRELLRVESRGHVLHLGARVEVEVDLPELEGGGSLGGADGPPGEDLERGQAGPRRDHELPAAQLAPSHRLPPRPARHDRRLERSAPGTPGGAARPTVQKR